MFRFFGNLDLCGQQVRKPCRTSMGFPVVLPHAESDEAAGCNLLLHLYFLLEVYRLLELPFPALSGFYFFLLYFCLKSDLLLINVVSAVPTKRSSHYIRAAVIGAISTLGFVLIVLFIFLWIWLLTKKERTAKKYTEVKKQVHKEPCKWVNSTSTISFPSPYSRLNLSRLQVPSLLLSMAIFLILHAS